MTDPIKRMQLLAEKWANGTITEPEKQEFNDWYHSHSDEAPVIIEGIASADNLKQQMFAAINDQITLKRSIRPWTKVAAAAAILFLLATGGYFLLQPTSKPDMPITESRYTGSDVLPGTDGAILTTHDGKQISLDDAPNGKVTEQEGTDVVKSGSQLLYTVEPNTSTNLLYNTLSTTKGKQFQLILSDGTKVWLNAESSIRYPVSFAGNERKVEVNGEAYFEVAKDASKPFIVSKGDMNVTVLGTHFNVNSYNDEKDIKVTLIEGSVKVSQGQREETITPGQQAKLSNGNINVINADTEEAVAWKNGRFQFSNTDLATILRQAARWYDVDVEIQGGSTEPFGGSIPRNVNASQLFKILESTNKVTIEIKDRKVIVRPK